MWAKLDNNRIGSAGVAHLWKAEWGKAREVHLCEDWLT
jgi:hypothetical protein